MGRRTVIGICHLCGRQGPLSFEHVPPQAAFNDRPLAISRMEDVMKRGGRLDDTEAGPGPISQRGAGGFTLCGQCNSDTGGWYGRAYVEWAYQAARLAPMAKTAPRFALGAQIYPLRVLKQIVCMFFSANGDRWRQGYPSLVKFVKDRFEQSFDPRVRVGAYYNLSTKARQTGIVASMDIDGSRCVMSEISFPPLGFVMGIDSSLPDTRLIDITDFCRFRYDEEAGIFLKLPALSIASRLPADFRG